MSPDPLGLSEVHLRIVLEILKKYVPGREIRAFGSRAVGKAKPYSDLDLAIMGASLLPDGVMRNLKEAFEESNLPFQVDIVQWADSSPGFRVIIEKGPVLVQGESVNC